MNMNNAGIANNAENAGIGGRKEHYDSLPALMY
jgi:hypothetical protein